MKNLSEEFQEECRARVASYPGSAIEEAAKKFMLESTDPKYSYNFNWLGRPIIQYPQDMVAMQELIWQIKPDLIIETGIAHGGSLIMSASMLAMLDYCEAVALGEPLNIKASNRMVLGLDIDIREHNKKAIESHPLAHKIKMIQGSSIANEIAEKVYEFSKPYKKILICLDSNHTHDHVLNELRLYAPLVSQNSYCVVFDTIIEYLPDGMYPNRTWGPGNNPRSAIDEYFKELSEGNIFAVDGGKLNFEIDQAIDNKILISVARNGFLRRV